MGSKYCQYLPNKNNKNNEHELNEEKYSFLPYKEDPAENDEEIRLMEYDYPTSNNRNVFFDVEHQIKNIDNKELQGKVHKFIEAFSNSIDNCIPKSIDNPISPINFSFDKEEKKVFLEWIFGEFRIGFVISNESKCPFWFLVDVVRNCNTSGRLDNHNFENIIQYLLKYVLENT